MAVVQNQVLKLLPEFKCGFFSSDLDLFLILLLLFFAGFLKYGFPGLNILTQASYLYWTSLTSLLGDPRCHEALHISNA
jgi:hypothetical protein